MQPNTQNKLCYSVELMNRSRSSSVRTVHIVCTRNSIYLLQAVESEGGWHFKINTVGTY